VLLLGGLGNRESEAYGHRGRRAMSAATVCSALVGSPPPFAIRPNVSRSLDKAMSAPPVAQSPAVSKAFPSALNLGANCRITETSLVGSFAFTADWVWALKLLISLQNCAFAAAAGSAVGGGETGAVPSPHADSAIGRPRTSDVKSLMGHVFGPLDSLRASTWSNRTKSTPHAKSLSQGEPMLLRCNHEHHRDQSTTVLS
jgi:hypothetical protein